MNQLKDFYLKKLEVSSRQQQSAASASGRAVGHSTSKPSSNVGASRAGAGAGAKRARITFPKAESEHEMLALCLNTGNITGNAEDEGTTKQRDPTAVKTKEEEVEEFDEKGFRQVIRERDAPWEDYGEQRSPEGPSDG